MMITGIVAAMLLVAPFDFEPGDVDLKFAVDEALKPGTLDDAVTSTMTLTVINRTDRPAEGFIVMWKPPLLERGEIPFSVKGGGETKRSAEFTLPGPATEVVELRLALEVGGRTLLTMEVRLTKVGGWQVAGPYSGAGFDVALPPETGEAEEWMPLDPRAEDGAGYFDLNKALGFHEFTTAYIRTGLWAEKETKAVLSLGSDDSIQVWHRGDLIHSHKIHRGSAPGQDRVAVTLNEGRNEFMLKVSNEDGGWGFHFDMLDDQGHPVPGIRREVGAARLRQRDAELEVCSVTRTSAVFAWKSDEPVMSSLSVVSAKPGRTLVYDGVAKEKMITRRTGTEPVVKFETLPSTSHRLEVGGLQPGRRYLARAESASAVTFNTLPPEGMTQFLVLKLACVVFKATTPPKDKDLNGASMPCPAEMVEQMKRDMEQTALFYWVTSGLRLVLDVEYFETDRYHTGSHELYGVGYGEEDEEAFKLILKDAGRKVEEFDGRLFVSMEKRWDEKRKQWYYPASGGGTIGPELWPGYGKSAWKGGADNAWLFCHEFQHQLDALYNYSNGPAHLFCHFQPWDDTAHRHGEHWDGIAWILLEWAGYVSRGHQGRPYLEPELGHRYFLSRWGRVVMSADQDHDGIPDKDQRVPLDEARFASDPGKIDTDGDGLTDLEEIMATHWVEWGHGECWAGEPSMHHANPREPDSDGDGMEDGKDPYPVYPMNPRIPKGDLDHVFAEFHDQAFDGDFTLGWDDDFLYIGCKAKVPPERLKIFLDLNDDGWFMGADNYDLRVRKSPDGFSVNPRFHNCGVPGKWPFYEDGRLEAGRHVSVRMEREAFLVAVARAPEMGLELVIGERIGILIALLPEGGTGRPPSRGDLTLFEPHTFFTFTLETE